MDLEHYFRAANGGELFEAGRAVRAMISTTPAFRLRGPCVVQIDIEHGSVDGRTLFSSESLGQDFVDMHLTPGGSGMEAYPNVDVCLFQDQPGQASAPHTRPRVALMAPAASPS